MKPVETVGETHSYGPPAAWDQSRDGPCGILSVRMQPFNNGPHKECLSTWKPNQEELMKLLAGGVVILSIVMPVQPPVALLVESVDEQAARATAEAANSLDLAAEPPNGR